MRSSLRRVSLRNKDMTNVLFITDNWVKRGLEKANITVAQAVQTESRKTSIYTMGKMENHFPACDMDLEMYGNSLLNRKLYIYGTALSAKYKANFFVDLFIKWQVKKIIKQAEQSNSKTLVFSGYSVELIPEIKNKYGTKYKTIAWVHNSTKFYTEGFRRKYNYPWVINGFSYADEVVVLTEQDQQDMLPINQNCTKIYNPVTMNFYEKSSLESKNISFVGRLEEVEVKGLDYLVDIAKQLPENWKITVAGGGDLQAFNELIKKSHTEDKIQYCGELSGKDLEQHYLDSSIYMMTSRKEGLPLVLIEAMGAGLPIIAFEQSGSYEILSSGKTGILVEQGNIEGFAQELLKLINSASLRKEYQEKSLRRVDDFSLPPIVHKWSKVL